MKIYDYVDIAGNRYYADELDQMGLHQYAAELRLQEKRLAEGEKPEGKPGIKMVPYRRD